MKKGIVFIVLAIYGIMAAFCNSYKWKAQTGEKKARKDGTIFHVWERKDITEEEFKTLKDTEFSKARIVKRDGATNYIIERDGLQIVLIEISD